jgi:pimeloyl-ACP methyl ester carboxylesterase
MLLHGTNSSRAVWEPVRAELSQARDVIRVDLPAHGESPATSFAPPDWAHEVAELMDELDLGRVAVVGHSSGGWTALELAKLGRATGALALTPAGLWRRHSPLLTDAGLLISWRLGRLLGEAGLRPLDTRTGRRIALAQISARPADVPAELARDTAMTVLGSKHFREHFRRTRVQRYLGGQQIPAAVPVHVVWGAKDRIAPARTSRSPDQLPAHAQIETWPECGHMVMWDAPERLVRAALALV